MVHPEMELMKTDISTVKCTVRRDDEAQLPHQEHNQRTHLHSLMFARIRTAHLDHLRLLKQVCKKPQGNQYRDLLKTSEKEEMPSSSNIPVQ